MTRQRTRSDDAQETGTFSQILSSNIDAHIDSSPQTGPFFVEPAASFGLPLRNVVPAHTAVSASSSTTYNADQWLIDAELPGNVLPAPGDSLPLATGEPAGVIPTVNTTAPESDAVLKLRNQLAFAEPAAPVEPNEPPLYDDVHPFSFARDASLTGRTHEALQPLGQQLSGSLQTIAAYGDQRPVASTSAHLSHSSHTADQPVDQPVDEPVQAGAIDADQLLAELSAAGHDVGTLEHKLHQPLSEQSASQGPNPSLAAFSTLSSPLLNAAGSPSERSSDPDRSRISRPTDR